MEVGAPKVDDKPRKEDVSKKEDKPKKEESPEATGEPSDKKEEASTQNDFVDDKRLFVMNLSYTVTKEELQDLFGKYGQVDDIEIPFRKGGRGTPLGLGFVRYAESESAI